MTNSFSGALRYQVPDHQGQEVLGAALHEQGYDWTSVFEGGRTHLLIDVPDGGDLDREHVRSILARQHRASLSGPDIIYTEVRFEDEPELPVEENTRRTPVRPPVLARPDGLAGASTHDMRPVRRRASLVVPMLRAGAGGLLLAFPGAITRLLIPGPDEGDRVVVRLLGARHLVQAVVTAAQPTDAVRTVGAMTDAAHGASALAYAALRADHRRAALISAGVALAFAVAEVRRLRS